MFGAQEFCDSLIGGIVDEDGAEKGLFRLEIVRRLAQARVFRAG